MADSGAGTEPGSKDVEVPGETELVARVAALEDSLARKEAEVAEGPELVLRAAAELAKANDVLAAREARAKRERAEVAKAKNALASFQERQGPDWRDWAGLAEDVLEKVATLVAQRPGEAQAQAEWATWLRDSGDPYWTEEKIQEEMEERKRKFGHFVFARVCKPWRKVQLKVGGLLRTRVESDMIAPGSVALAKWALAEGCPREAEDGATMAHVAAEHGHLELVRWLCGEGGFAMDERVMNHAARSGNLELVRWLRGEGCPWNRWTCYWAVIKGHEEVLRWVRENGCPWKARVRDWAAVKLKYTDDFGNLVEESDDESDLVDLASEESDAEDASEANLLGSEQEDGHGWSQESPLYGPPLWTLYSGD